MKHFTAASPVFAMLALAGFVGSPSARAATVTDIAIPFTTSTTGDWSGQINGSTIFAAPTNGNTGTGITFADWNGQFNEINPGQTTVFSVPSVALTANSEVNTLLNNFFGDDDEDAIVTFTNSDGQTDAIDLIGGQTIRDYNQNSFQNTLTGTGVGVTAQEWWNNGADGQRLDVQSFLLPASWAGTNLVSFSIDDDSPTTTDDILSAAQVVTNAPVGTAVTPEPSSLILAGSGMLALLGAARRRLAA